MSTIIPLDLVYSHTTSPARRLREAVNLEVRYVRQISGPGRFAIVYLTCAPSDVPLTVQLIDAAQLSAEDLEACYADGRECYPQALARGMAKALNELHEQQQTIVNLQIMLTNFRVHPVDSSEHSFVVAGEQAIRQLSSMMNDEDHDGAMRFRSWIG
jgi:translation elongation factor EF-G